MKATRDTVDVWGRRITLGQLGLPKQIDVSVRSESLLAGPVELVLRGQDGQALPWTEESRKIRTRGHLHRQAIDGRRRQHHRGCAAPQLSAVVGVVEDAREQQQSLS